ncbi:MAG: efflux RND transporter periplasmic adaptor subunit [Planctomycetota bacterium]|nr:MAG: efflux RND transporter periplasmic adaptor subunit [Planctomycetota bacterium]
MFPGKRWRPFCSDGSGIMKRMTKFWIPCLAMSAGLWAAWPSFALAQHDRHAEHADEADHDEHGHGDHHEEGVVTLTPAVLEEMGIETAVAGPGTLEQSVRLTGEIVLNPDRLTHIVPRVGGIAREVRATIGDAVREGDVLAVLESSDLAEAKANYLGALQRVSLTRATLEAKKKLQGQGIVSELDFLAAQRDAAEAEILLRAADVKLHTYGFTHAQLAGIDAQDEEKLLLYEVRAPFAGVLVEKHITLGELVTDETDIFLIADLGTVWVHLTVHQKDLARIRPGIPVVISAGYGFPETRGTIEYVSPIVDESTRTATARVVLSNEDGTWRPGLFVTAQAVVEETTVDVLVPRSAIQMVDGQPAIFVRGEKGFQPHPVVVGRTNETFAEIRGGLKPGEEYVARGAFSLKAELEKASFGGEGHAH